MTLAQGVAADWLNTLMELQLAKDHAGTMAAVSRTPSSGFIDQLLPSLFYLRVASVFDQGLEAYLSLNGITLPKDCFANFGGRVKYLSRANLLLDSTRVEDAKARRNEIAHETTTKATWSETLELVDLVQTELINLGVLGTRPKLETYFERNVDPDPEDEHLIMSHYYRYGVRVDGTRGIEFVWVVQYGA
jgi:hypothetical protein